MTASTEDRSEVDETGVPARPGVFASFEEREFRKAWLGAVLFGLGMWMERLATGWFVLNETGSVFLAALTFAIRTIPNLVLGPIAGAVSDRLPRARVLTATAVVRMIAAALMSLIVFAGFAAVPILIALVFVTGSTIAFQNTALQPLQAIRLESRCALQTFHQRSTYVANPNGGAGFLFGERSRTVQPRRPRPHQEEDLHERPLGTVWFDGSPLLRSDVTRIELRSLDQAHFREFANPSACLGLHPSSREWGRRPLFGNVPKRRPRW